MGLIISGVIDGPLSGGLPKAIELFVTADIADLSIYGIGSANNGGGSDGEEITLSGSATAGQYLYVASEADGFQSYFGFAPDFIGGAANINGDDAIELFENGAVIDVFGDINVDGTGEPWEHLDGWAYRVADTGPDGATFVLDNWVFSGPNALDGESDNDTAASPFPTATFTADASTPIEFSIAAVDAVKDEGDSGVTNFRFQIFRANTDGNPASIDYTVSSAVADAADFNGVTLDAPNQLNFDPSQAFTFIDIPVAGDIDVEADELFTVTLSNPSAGAVITTASATGTIQNDDIAPGTFTLEILHVTDQEGSTAELSDIIGASAVLNALEGEDLGGDGVVDNTVRLSSGDAFIPGVFFDASEAVFGSAGIADILIQNELGFDAIALGNHEFDFGAATLASLIDGSATGVDQDGNDFIGAAFPYLSANLDFSTDPDLQPLEVAGGQAPQANVVTSSTILDVNGEPVAVVGATVPTLGSISSPGTVGVSPVWASGNPTDAELDALAAEIQLEVDALLAANTDLNKVILTAHMQRLEIEVALAGRLENVDVIIGGGSNTRLFDDNDVPRAGDSDQGQYPLFVTNAGGTTTAVVNTDGSYKYVGRLVIDFDADGNVVADSYDETVSGAYATDAAGVTALGAGGQEDADVVEIVNAIETEIIATEGNVFGVSDVFLNGNRSGAFTADDPDGVRTQETNLGNLTADANLVYANEIVATESLGDPVLISIKNGGGIRANIGETVVPAGGTAAVRQPNGQLLDGDGDVIKPEGGISQTDIQSTLAFNNGLVLVDITRQELVNLLEGGVSALPSVDGGFLQVAGLKFSFDETQQAQVLDANGAITTPWRTHSERRRFRCERHSDRRACARRRTGRRSERNVSGGDAQLPARLRRSDPRAIEQSLEPEPGGPSGSRRRRRRRRRGHWRGDLHGRRHRAGCAGRVSERRFQSGERRSGVQRGGHRAGVRRADPEPRLPRRYGVRRRRHRPGAARNLR